LYKYFRVACNNLGLVVGPSRIGFGPCIMVLKRVRLKLVFGVVYSIKWVWIKPKWNPNSFRVKWSVAHGAKDLTKHIKRVCDKWRRCGMHAWQVALSYWLDWIQVF